MEWFFKIWSDTVGDSRGKKNWKTWFASFLKRRVSFISGKGMFARLLRCWDALRIIEVRGSVSSERLTHMAGVLEQGWPATARREDFLRPLNGKVVFTVHNSLPCDSAGYAIPVPPVSPGPVRRRCGHSGVHEAWLSWDLNVHASHPQHSRDVVDGIPYDRIPGNGASIFGDESHPSWPWLFTGGLGLSIMLRSFMLPYQLHEWPRGRQRPPGISGDDPFTK